MPRLNNLLSFAFFLLGASGSTGLRPKVAEEPDARDLYLVNVFADRAPAKQLMRKGREITQKLKLAPIGTPLPDAAQFVKDHPEVVFNPYASELQNKASESLCVKTLQEIAVAYRECQGKGDCTVDIRKGYLCEISASDMEPECLKPTGQAIAGMMSEQFLRFFTDLQRKSLLPESNVRMLSEKPYTTFGWQVVVTQIGSELPQEVVNILSPSSGRSG